MTGIKKIGVLVMALLTGNVLGFNAAQAGTTIQADTLNLSLQQCIEIALDESPTIRIAQSEIDKVDYANKEKLSGLFPTINASANYSRTLKKQKLFFNIPGMPANPEGIEVGQDNTFVGVVQAAMPIISPTLWASIRMNETDASIAIESARSSKISLVNSVTKAFYGVLQAQE